MAEKKFRETLRPLGAPKIRVLRLAGPPLILPISSIKLYGLDRNVRMATVIGLFGACGIGQHTKVRYNLRHLRHRQIFRQDISPNSGKAHRMRRDSMLEKPVAVSKADERRKPALGPPA